MAPERQRSGVIPEPTVARLPIYQRIAAELARTGQATVSSEQLAALAGVTAAKVRKDLAHLGKLGTRGTGYDAAQLVRGISEVMGADQDWPVVIVGIGNLGRALINARGFLARGYRLVGLVDTDTRILGTEISGHTVVRFDELPARLSEKVAIGIIATPASAAQDAADQLVALGAGSLLNFAPTVLMTPPHIRVRYVDLSIELQVLSHFALTDHSDAGAMSSVGIQPIAAPWAPAAGEHGARS
jgi:redox-sensing transcriptional repressor